MITNSELQIANESYTKKDFYQLYPEILDLVTKITARWNPDSSNESDPGVVLLKLLAFIADKNNYNIDKNVLECFMPSASQEESMRKLCNMMGYEMSYYQSAVTDISFMYQGTGFEDNNIVKANGIVLKAYDSSVTNEDGDVNYILMNDVVLGNKYEAKTVEAIEGTLCNCTTNNSDNANNVLINNLDVNKRFYLPEVMIAENGIWIKNIEDSSKNTWTRVDNLNTQVTGNKVWKFGFDSKENLPYIQFPDDIGTLIGNGLNISYVRTTGVNGNVSANVLDKLASGTKDANDVSLDDVDGTPVLIIANKSATVNGADKETLDEAYNKFKKTVGTFDTLVTCRDYANKIYELLDTDNTTPMVSNIQVSDIRDDLNYSNSIVTLNDSGIAYEDKTEVGESGDALINHFDLIIYPFNPISSNYSRYSYTKSFQPRLDNTSQIIDQLDEYKTISHTIKVPLNYNDIYCIKNYYNIKAKITTTYKVTAIEKNIILANIYKALYKEFNMRNIDFGEEIPFDTILKCIQNSDTRVKNVSLEEPTLTTKAMMKDGSEELVGGDWVSTTAKNRELYLKLLSKNILSGRVPLLNYNDSFGFGYGQTPYTYGESGDSYNLVYGHDTDATQQIYAITTSFKPDMIGARTNNVTTFSKTLEANQVVQMMAPNLQTSITYPAYVNYYFHKANVSANNAVPAVADSTTYTTLAAFTAWYADTANTGKFLYIRSYNASNIPGKLVDSSKNKYVARTTFSTGSTYYSLTTIGTNATLDTITSDDEYALEDGDVLYINYTDSDDNVFNIKYEYGKTTTNGVVDTDGVVNIIRPNFDLQDTNSVHVTTGKGYAKTSGYDTTWTSIDGMFSFSSSEQIEMRGLVKVNLKTSMPCYWMVNNVVDNVATIPFDTNGEYILQEGEYFFYSNNSYTDLATLGSGTKLINHGYPNINFSIDYSYSSKVDVDEVNNSGLGAFSSVAWKQMKFNDTQYLTIQEMQFITLIEGSELIDVTSNAALTNNTLLNTWQEITDASYVIDEGAIKTLTQFKVPNITWMIRSRLDLNIGPNLTQVIHTNDSVELFTQSGNTYTSLVELVAHDNKLPQIKSNYLMQRSGGNLLKTEISKIANGEETTVADLKVLVFAYTQPTQTPTGATDPVSLTTGTSHKLYTSIGLANYKTITLNTAIVDGDFGIIAFYYAPAGTDILATAYPTLAASAGTLSVYNDNTAFSGRFKSGLNIIKVSASCTLTITADANDNGNLIFNNLKLVNTSNSGVDVDSLKIDVTTGHTIGTTTEIDYLLNLIKTASTPDIFYYNADIDNTMLIDEDNMSDPKVWYDYNNVCNKFVISELDAGTGTTPFENITLTKSSLL